jgi:ABC-type branched-subunit amino acid transport system substrate-binding protein
VKDSNPDRRSLFPLIIVIGAVFFLIGFQYFEQREQEPASNGLENDTVTIGVICPCTRELEAYKFLADLAEQDINKHMKEQGSSLDFNFIVGDAQGQSVNAYDIAKEHYDSGNKLIVGLSWSSQMDTFFSFAKDRGCLIISPGSTQPWPWRLAPSTYRLYPADHLYTVPLVEAVESLNISKVIFLRLLHSSFADIMREEFTTGYNGEIIDVQMDTQGADSTLEQATEVLQEEIQEAINEHGENHVAVYFLGINDHLEKILDSTTDDTIFRVPWFVWNWYNWYDDSGTRYTGFEEDVSILSRIKLIGVHPAIPDNPVFTRINGLYMERFGEPISMIHGNIYDGLWITALSVIQAGSIDGVDVGEVVPEIAKHYVGVSGNCSLNDWGDRWGVDWTLYGYKLEGNTTKVTQFGLYSYTTGKITWYDN